MGRRPTAPDGVQGSADGKEQEGSKTRPGQETEVICTVPSPSFSPGKVLCWIPEATGAVPPLTFRMWSRNSGEERQSSGLENWRQLYWKRGSRSGSRANNLQGEAQVSETDVSPCRPQQAAALAAQWEWGGPDF